MASNHMPLRDGPGRGTMHNHGEDEWHAGNAYDFMNNQYTQPIPSPSGGTFAPFTPYPPFYDSVSGPYSEHSAPAYDFPFTPSNTGVDEPFYPDPSQSPLPNEYFPSQPRPPQPLGTNTQRNLQPRPLSHQASPSYHTDLNTEPVRPLQENSGAPLPTPTSSTGKRGRGGPLEEQTRHEAARNRADGSCLFHVTRKTKCPRPETPESSTVCGECKATNRICYRLSQKIKEALFIARPLLSDSETRQRLLTLTRTMALTTQRRFSIEVNKTLSFQVDQLPLATRESSVVDLEALVLEGIGDKPFQELLESMAFQAPITEKLKRLETDGCDHSAEKNPPRICPIKELLDSVRKCVLIYRLLISLPVAQLRAPSSDLHAAKCFIISLACIGISKLRDSIKHSTEQLFKVFTQHRKVYADPSYERVVTALVALCALVRAIAKSQNAKDSNNVLVDAISGLLPDAQLFAQQLELLGQGFCAITDPVPPTDGFYQNIEKALILDPVPRLLIMLDGSASESSLREEGAMPTELMQSISPWSMAIDGHSRNRGLPAQPVLPLFASNRLSPDARRVHHGSGRNSPSASDSDNGATWDLLSDKRSKSPAAAGPSSETPRSVRPYKRGRSDSLRTSAAHSGHKKAKSP